MKYFIPLILALSMPSLSDEYPSCNFSKTKMIAFTSENNLDEFTVSAIGTPCFEGVLSIVLKNEDGKIIHKYEKSLGIGDSKQPNYDRVIANYVEHVMADSIGRSSELPLKFECEVEEPTCEPYESNVVPMDQYLLYREQNVPSISHQVGYESWATWVYDKDKGILVKVLEGGV